NPNVMMELGIAIGSGKQWNILYNPDQDQSAERRGWFAKPRADISLPANLRGYEYLEYRNPIQLRDKLAEWARQTLQHSSPQIARRCSNPADGVLALLQAHPNLTMTEIAARTGVEVPMARLTVTELRRKGLVRNLGQRGPATRYAISVPRRVVTRTTE